MAAARPSTENPAPPQAPHYYQSWHPDKDTAAELTEDAVYLKFEKDGEVLNLPFHRDLLRLSAESKDVLIYVSMSLCLSNEEVANEEVDLSSIARLGELSVEHMQTCLLQLGEVIYNGKKPEFANKEECRAWMDFICALGFLRAKFLPDNVIAMGINRKGSPAELVDSLLWLYNGRRDQFPDAYSEILSDTLPKLIWEKAEDAGLQ